MIPELLRLQRLATNLVFEINQVIARNLETTDPPSPREYPTPVPSVEEIEKSFIAPPEEDGGQTRSFNPPFVEQSGTGPGPGPLKSADYPELLPGVPAVGNEIPVVMNT